MRPDLALRQSLAYCGEIASRRRNLTTILAGTTTMPELESYFTPEHLSGVFDSILDGHFDVIAERPRISTGADRIELDLFQRDKDKHFAAIRRKVLEGRYTFSPFLEREIPKADSKEMRTISIASIRDGVVQRALYDYLYLMVDARLSSSVFGYRKGRSAHDAVRLIRRFFANGRVFVFDADLRKFFDTVDHGVLLEMIEQLGLDQQANTLIRRFLKTGKISSAQAEEHKARIGKKEKYRPEPRHIGVPQGGVLSGLLSNLYLSPFDQAVESHYQGYVRYADDFLVCCGSQEECTEVKRLVQESLEPLKVNLNPGKTRDCVLAESGVDFLGFRISTRGIRVRGRNVAKFKARIQEVVKTQKVYRSPVETVRSLIRRLQFKIRGPNQEQLDRMAERGKIISPCRRSWIGFFRIVDDLEQIRSVDRWLRKQVSKFMWEKYRCRVGLQTMQRCGMPSLINSLWKARSGGEQSPPGDDG
jgi:group II intron reverse transcriptase/maturase